MRHSLRLRLIAVNAVLPMLTIATAGWFIRDANKSTFDDASDFAVATSVMGPGAAGEAIGAGNGMTGGSVLVSGVPDITRTGSGGTEAPDGQSYILNGQMDVVDSAGGIALSTSPEWSFQTNCALPITTSLTHLPNVLTPVDPGDAIPIVYSSTTGIAPSGVGQFVVVGQSGFVQAFQADRANDLSSLNLRVGVLIGLAGLICGAVGLLASQRIIAPVEALTGAARRMESGDLSQRVTHEGRDEIGQLSHAFNAMADSLERTESLRKTMTSDVAHELRTPLNNISGFVDMLADGLVEPDARVLSTLQDETQILVTLVNDLEQLSLGDAGRLALDTTETEFEPLAERAIHAMTPRATERDITLALESHAEESPVAVDVVRVDQVLRNLVENAIRHTPDGGDVVVRLERPTATTLSIAVEDTGPGIDPAHLPYIFERFYRADPSRNRGTGGSGLGLAIARQIVEAHGGSISAENRNSGGARFTIILPLVAD